MLMGREIAFPREEHSNCLVNNQIFSPENTHTSNMTQEDWIYIFRNIYTHSCAPVTHTPIKEKEVMTLEESRGLGSNRG